MELATRSSKRKVQALPEEPEKRARIEGRQGAEAELDWDEDDEDTYNPHDDDFSEAEGNVDTPITPISPGRKRFPSELKTIKCSQCPKTFNRPARLTAHMRTHTNERPYVCPYEDCDKAYFEDKHLQQHIKGSHTHERNFHCDWEGCNKSFLTSTRLKRHKDTHKGHDRFRCTAYPPCNQTFRKHQTLQRHIRSDHLDLSPYPCTYVNPVTSKACEAGFDGPTGLKQHMEKFHAPPQFFCSDCITEGFKSDRALQTHIRKEHANCIFCDLKCASQRELQKHIETQHSGTTLEERKNIPCTYIGCDKKFTKQNNLKTHIRTAHMGERYFCGTFDVSSYLDLHIFNDNDGCGKDFVSKASLADHVRTAHLGLPSVVNGSNRKKARQDSNTGIFDDEEGEEEVEEYIEEDEPPRQKRKPRSKTSKPSVIDELLGTSHAADPARNIHCIVPGCQYRFMREYDRQVHTRTAHAGYDPNHVLMPQPFSILPIHNGGFPFPEPSFGDQNMMQPMVPLMTPTIQAPATEFNPLDDQADIDWELQRRALEGGPFWVGGDGEYEANQDDWMFDENEMRRLIG